MGFFDFFRKEDKKRDSQDASGVGATGGVFDDSDSDSNSSDGSADGGGANAGGGDGGGGGGDGGGA